MYSLHFNIQVMVSIEYDLVHFLKSYSTEHGVVKPYLYLHIVVHGAFAHTYLFSTFIWETAYNKCIFGSFMYGLRLSRTNIQLGALNTLK